MVFQCFDDFLLLNLVGELIKRRQGLAIENSIQVCRVSSTTPPASLKQFGNRLLKQSFLEAPEMSFEKITFSSQSYKSIEKFLC